MEAGVGGGVKDAGVIVEAMQVLETLLDLTADANSELSILINVHLLYIIGLRFKLSRLMSSLLF